jgi:MFS family permease
MRIHELDRVAAANHLSLYFGGFAVGCLAIGTLSDRLGRRKPVLIGAGLVYCALWLLWLSALRMPIGVSYALFGLMGLATASFSLTWACAKEVNPPHLSGMSTSVTNMGGFLAGALLQPTVGLVMDLGWDGTVVDGVRQFSPGVLLLGLSVVAATSFVGLVASFFIRETGCRNIWKAD